MTDDDRAILSGKLFETYLQFEGRYDVSDDELDFYLAGLVGDFLLFVATIEPLSNSRRSIFCGGVTYLVGL